MKRCVRLQWVLADDAIAVVFDGTFYAWSLANLMARRFTECATREGSNHVDVAHARALAMFDRGERR